MMYVSRAVGFPFITAFFGMIYYRSRYETQEQVIIRVFYTWWAVCTPAILGLAVVFVNNLEYRTIYFEIRNGMYSTASYTVSNTLVQLPWMFALAVLTSIPAFLICGLEWANFGTTVVIYATNLFACDSLAQVCSLCSNPLIGVFLYVNAWSIGIVFNGLIFRITDVFWPLRTLSYVDPLYYTMEAIGYDWFSKATYDGALECTPGQLVPHLDPTGLKLSPCQQAGFYCQNVTRAVDCWGRTGKQVLGSLGMFYSAFVTEDRRAHDFGYILIIAIVCKATYMVGVWLKCRKSMVVDAKRSTAAPAVPMSSPVSD